MLGLKLVWYTHIGSTTFLRRFGCFLKMILMCVRNYLHHLLYILWPTLVELRALATHIVCGILDMWNIKCSHAKHGLLESLILYDRVSTRSLNNLSPIILVVSLHSIYLLSSNIESQTLSPQTNNLPHVRG